MHYSTQLASASTAGRQMQRDDSAQRSEWEVCQKERLLMFPSSPRESRPLPAPATAAHPLKTPSHGQGQFSGGGSKSTTIQYIVNIQQMWFCSQSEHWREFVRAWWIKTESFWWLLFSHQCNSKTKTVWQLNWLSKQYNRAAFKFGVERERENHCFPDIRFGHQKGMGDFSLRLNISSTVLSYLCPL